MNSKQTHRTNAIRTGQRFVVPLLLWLCAASVGFAASPYAGVYMGLYSSANDLGYLAMLVDNDGWGAMVEYSSTNANRGAAFEGFTIATNGAFSCTLPTGATVSGNIAGGNLTGSYYSTTTAWTFSARLKVGTGVQQAAVGLYSGFAPGWGTGTPNGVLNVILAADGTFYGLHENLDEEQTRDGFAGTVNAQNQVSLQSVGGVAGTGSLDQVNFKMAGTWSSTNGNGTFTLTRTHFLLGASCTYSLLSASAKVNGSGASGFFPVTTSFNCPWGAMAAQGWIHTTSSGTGSGTVYYTVDANANNAFRTGTITVGGQSFTITQGPAGYVWHDVFGWLYDAGSRWYHREGFDWMWFNYDNQWAWSSGLDGWVAVMSGSRTLWSTQFRWLKPSDTDLNRASTSTLGSIYVGKYNGTAIPDGWVASDLFGYVWAAGDGAWFYSTIYGWLLVTPDGGIWCGSQNRWLQK